ATIAEGEVHQLVIQNDLSTTQEQYLEVIRGKTAALFSAACEVGAVVAGRPAGEQAALAEFGDHLGIAFQLVDDALDYAADQSKLGKTVGDDFREGKITMPVLAAYHAGGADARAFWLRTIEASSQEHEDLDRALGLIRETGAIRVTLDLAAGFAERAKQRLAAFPRTALRDALMDVADFTVSRAS
ncbi:MAG: polyprenyl synthetase family protein, partial [Acetobacteraceae bacterium]|nr:polyprenyl synthetase family protein [Acetobacteraceae bacterium]